MKLFAASSLLLLAYAAQLAAQCPSLKVTGPAGLTIPGDSMTFHATVDPLVSKVEYKWTVTAGTITEGQGTPRINVATNRAMSDSEVTATVEIASSSDCNRTAFETAIIAPIIQDPILDEWGALKPNDERVRLDALFQELSNNPTHIGVLRLVVTKNERFDARNERVKLVVKHARYRGFDIKRIWFILLPGTERRTAVFRQASEIRPGIFCTGVCVTIRGGN